MANESINKKIVQAHLKAAVDKIKSGNASEINEALRKLDVDNLAKKLNELDPSTLKEYESSINDIKKRINDDDLKKLSNAIGPKGPEIASRIKDVLNRKIK